MTPRPAILVDIGDDVLFVPGKTPVTVRAVASVANDAAAAGPAAPAAFSVATVADGVLISWTAVPGLTYEVEAAPDVAGVPGTFAVLERDLVAALYLAGATTTSLRWYRVRARNDAGVPGAYAGPSSASIRSSATLASGLTQAQADIAAEVTARANGDNSLASQITTLGGRLTNAETGVAANASATSGLTTRVTNAEGAISAQSGQITSLESGVTGLQNGLTATNSSVTNLTSRVTSVEGVVTSQGSSITSLNSQVAARARVHFQAAPPAGSAHAVNDLWFDSDDNNRQYRWSGTAWVLAEDVRWTQRNRVFAQAAIPDGTLTTGDLWIDTDDENRMYRWDGGNWLPADDGRIASTASALSTLTTRVTNAEGVNTSQANSITALQSDARAAGATAADWVRNPTFDPAYDQMGLGWLVVSTASAPVPAGCPFPWAARLAGRGHETNLPPIPVQPGDVIEFSVLLAWQTGPEDFWMVAKIYSSPTTGLAAWPIAFTVSPQGNSSWRRVTGRYTVPENPQGRFLFPFLMVNQPHTGGSTIWYATDWRVRNITAAARAESKADAAASAVTSLTTRVTDAEGVNTALAGQITSLTTTVNGNTATINSQQTSINGLLAQVSLRLDVNGRVIGYTLNNNGGVGNMDIVADNFRLFDPPGTTAVLEYLEAAPGPGKSLIEASFTFRSLIRATAAIYAQQGIDATNAVTVRRQTDGAVRHLLSETNASLTGPTTVDGQNVVRAVQNATADAAGNVLIPELTGLARLGAGGAQGVSDWNAALSNGWFMADGALNAPASGWLLGQVVVHDINWVTQEVWQFALGVDAPRFRRFRLNGTWTPWVDAARSHIEARLNDTRGFNAPVGNWPQRVVWDFKARSTLGWPGTAYFGAVATISQWGHDSGGGDHQLVFDESARLFHRYGTRASGWGAWREMWHSANPDISDTRGNLRDLPVFNQNASYTFVPPDRGRYFRKSDSGTPTWTIPADTAAWPIDSIAISVCNDASAGNVTIARAAGVALMNGTVDADLVLAPGQSRTLVKMDLNRWRVH